jgi:hypothetical protein
MKSSTLSLGWLALVAMAGQLAAATITTNVALRGTVVDVSAIYSTAYPVSSVIDNNLNEGTNAPVSYWLAPNGSTNAYFILDLRGTFPIESIVLYNTHNRQAYDRGTGPFVIFGGNAIQPRPPSSGRVDMYYPFDADVNDYGTNHLNGTFYDLLLNPLDPTASLSTDVPSARTNDTHSLGFSGGGEFVEIMDLNQPTTYSISVWVKLQVVQACSIVLRTAAAGEQANWSHQIRVTAAGQFEAYTWDGAGKTVTGTTVIRPDTWYHVLVTAQNVGVERLFVNGVQEGGTVAIGALWSAGDRWRVGSVYKGVNTPLVGQLDDLAFWFGPPLPTNLVARLAAGQSPLTVTNTAVTSVGYQVVNPQLVSSGTLSQVAYGDPVLQPQTFAVSPPVTARYLQFQTLGSTYTNNNVGLNEIQVMAQADTSLPAIGLAKAVFLSWPFKPFPVVLQSSPSLNTPVWTTVTNTPTLSDTTWGIYMPATNYYQLITP